MELREMGMGKFFEDGLAAWAEHEAHPAAIILGRHAPGIPFCDQSIYQPNCAVMSNL
jgi:hypothetical protein